MQVTIPGVDVQQANLQTVDIGQVVIGPITVGDLVLNNTDLSMTAAQGTLQNVSVTVSIHVTVEWHVHVGMPDWIPDINIGDIYDLGTFTFGPISVGNIVIPGLNNIHVHIPTLTAQDMGASADPMSLRAQNATAEQVHLQNVALPSTGFTIAGLTLNSVSGHNITVPTAKLDQATIGHVHGPPLAVPSFTLNNLNLPSAQAPDVSSSAPLDIPANLTTQSPGFDAGILRLFVHLTPSALSHVEHLELTNLNASVTVGQVVLHNITLPYDVLNLTLSQIGIGSVSVPAFTAA